MRTECLTANYPCLYHMAAKGAWESIRQHGLLSTTALLDLFEIKDDHRHDIELTHRPDIVIIKHTKYGNATIRDQKPMSDSGLVKALRDGITVEEWYKTLNSKVFFWTNRSRLHKLLSARAYRDEEHDVLCVDTKGVVEAFEKRVRLCPMNSGATKPMPHPRGRDTFLPIEQYPWESWVKKRGVTEAVVEVAFEGGVPDILKFTNRVTRMKGGAELDVIYEK